MFYKKNIVHFVVIDEPMVKRGTQIRPHLNNIVYFLQTIQIIVPFE